MEATRTDGRGPPDMGNELINASNGLEEEDEDDGGAEAVLRGVDTERNHYVLVIRRCRDVLGARERRRMKLAQVSPAPYSNAKSRVKFISYRNCAKSPTSWVQLL